MTLSGSGVDAVTGAAAVKTVQDLEIVGQSIPRYDIPAKVDGSLEWAVDVQLPGMVHARNVKPPMAGARVCARGRVLGEGPAWFRAGRSRQQLHRGGV